MPARREPHEDLHWALVQSMWGWNPLRHERAIYDIILEQYPGTNSPHSTQLKRHTIVFTSAPMCAIMPEHIALNRWNGQQDNNQKSYDHGSSSQRGGRQDKRGCPKLPGAGNFNPGSRITHELIESMYWKPNL